MIERKVQNMNKQERHVIEDEINRLIDRMDRREIRQERWAKEGDAERVRLCKRNDMRDMAKLDGIDFVLNYLGYRRKYENGRNVLYKVG